MKLINIDKYLCYGWVESLAVMHASGPGGHLALPDMVAPTREWKFVPDISKSCLYESDKSLLSFLFPKSEILVLILCLLNLQLYICIVNEPVLARGHSNDLWKSKNLQFPNQRCWWSFHLSYSGAADNWQLQHEGAIDAPTAGRSKKHVSSGLQASEGLHRALGGGFELT